MQPVGRRSYRAVTVVFQGERKGRAGPPGDLALCPLGPDNPTSSKCELVVRTKEAAGPEILGRRGAVGQEPPHPGASRPLPSRTLLRGPVLSS